MSEELLGYLLGALEPEEAAAVEARLAADPALRFKLESLREQLRLLGARAPMIDPPAGLAARVGERVAEVRRRELAAALQPASLGRAWRRVDAVAVIGVSLAALVLFVPVLASQRYRAQAVACREKLHTVGRALIDYSRAHAGFFPEVPAEGNLARAGLYVVELRAAGYLPDESGVFCPAVERRFAGATADATAIFPTRARLAAADPAEAEALFTTLDGAYGYALGYVEGGRYHVRRNQNRATFAVLGDSPQLDGAGGRSHGCGQNVWFEDGHAEFLKRCRLRIGDDEIYENRAGFVGAGIGADDVVLGAASATPRLTPVSVRD